MHSGIDKAAKLVECIADLQLGEISTTEWLNQMTDVVQCDAACVTSWTVGQPDTAIASYSDDPIQFDHTWLAWVDNLIQQVNPEQPSLLEKIATAADVADNSENSPLNDPKLLIAFLDAEPAIILFAFRLDDRPDGWSDDDRHRLTTILPGLCKAHKVHQKINKAETRLNIANNALDAIPRAIIALSPTGEVVRSNGAARELFERDTFSVKNGKLNIADSRVMQQFQDKLAEIRILTPESLSQFTWNRSFRGCTNRRNYQIMLSGFALADWHLESSSYDRFAELIVGSLDTMTKPTTVQLRDFYDLSSAQARVVLALLEGNDVMTSAAKLHVSVNTIRSHVRSIYEKLGVDNQRDLLRLLSSTLVNYGSKQ